MRVSITKWYVEVGPTLPFAYEMQCHVENELAGLISASPAFLNEYGEDWTLNFRLTPQIGAVENLVTGPHVYKKWKDVTYTICPSIDVILRSEDGKRCALRFLFDGIRMVLARYKIDTTELAANEERIIDEICSDPKMFENKPWPTLANDKPPPRPAPEDPALPAFKRLYKRIDGVLHYEAVGAHEGIALHHYGKVGHKGKTKELPYNREAPKKAVETFLGVAVAKGFTEMPLDHEIEIQYAIDGMGTPEDFDKLSAIEDHLHGLLGELGLGVCMENSIGGGTMEVCCFVVDADIAIKCIKKNLKGTRFADYATMHVVDRGEEEDDDE